MMKMARPFAVLATALLAAAAPAAPAFAQPGVVDPAVAEDPPPVNAGTVVIVTPQAPVVAQPAGPPPMASATSPAPQTDDWNNVSHINGQLVKVGEHGDYLYNNGKTTNIASNPIGWMFGFYGVSISHAVHQNVALRGDANIFLCHGGQGSRGTIQPQFPGDDATDGVWMSWWMDGGTADVDALYALAVERGLHVTMPPRDEPWGVREFHLRHPDGHMFRISAGLGED